MREREGGRGEWEGRQTHWFVVLLTYAFISCLFYVSWSVIEHATLGYWDDAITDLPSQGSDGFLKSVYLVISEYSVKLSEQESFIPTAAQVRVEVHVN